MEANQIGHYVLSLVTRGGASSKFGKGLKYAASYFEWAFAHNRPNLPNGGLHLPLTGGRLYRFESPHPFSSREAVTMGDARDG